MKNRIDFGLNTLEKNPRQNSELDAAAATPGVFRTGLPGLPRQVQKIGDADPAQQIVDQRGLADQHAEPERRDDGVNRQTRGNAGSRQNARAPTPVERKGGQIRHVRSRGEFEQQDCKDEFQHVAPGFTAAR